MAHPNLMTLPTPADMAQRLAARVRHLRLLKGWTRNTLAQRAGVSTASLKRFENTGQASLDHLLRLAHALARLDELDQLLRPPTAQSMTELEQRATHSAPKRGRL